MIISYDEKERARPRENERDKFRILRFLMSFFYKKNIDMTTSELGFYC